MDRNQRSIVARIHGLQHVECFLTADLAHHDSVRTHTQGVDDQLALAHGSFTFQIRRTALQTDNVFLPQLESAELPS